MSKPVETLTAEQAASDLLALHSYLYLNYAGYDDTGWLLGGRGTSWAKHNQIFLDRIKKRDPWPAYDFHDLVVDYLRVVPDSHLWLYGNVLRDGKREFRYSYPATGTAIYFADLRVREQGGRMVLVDVPSGLSIRPGDQLVHIPVIGSPCSARLGQVYLFPTLPRQPGNKDYLVGILAAKARGVAKESMPEPQSIRISAMASYAAGKAARRDVEIPVHRGRCGYRSNEKTAWTLDLRPIPILGVRTMSGDELNGMPETAIQLRELPLVVLDLRGNGGGNSPWATSWAKGFSKQNYSYLNGILDLRRGETDPLRRYGLGSSGTDKANNSGPYRGKLFVLMDNRCASAGEELAGLAAQIPRTVVVGENSSGLSSYTLGLRFCLPHTNLIVEFGSRKLSPDWRDFREGVGMFPDYWLDDPDPVAAIAAYCSPK